MSARIDEVRGQVEAVVRKLEQFEGAARQELAALRQIEQNIVAQGATLRQLRSEVESG